MFADHTERNIKDRGNPGTKDFLCSIPMNLFVYPLIILRTIYRP